MKQPDLQWIISLIFAFGWLSFGPYVNAMEKRNWTYHVVTSEVPVTLPSSLTTVPSYILKDGDDNVCIRMDFFAKLNITFRAKINDKVVTRNTDVTLTPEAKTSGRCRGNGTDPYINIAWQNGNFRLRFDFKSEVKTKRDLLTAEKELYHLSSISKIYFIFDTSDVSTFRHSADKATHTALSRLGTNFFMSPFNTSFTCNASETINFYEKDGYEKTVEMDISSLQIQAYNIDPSGEFSRKYLCDADKMLPQANIVPVIIAGVLAGIIVLTIMGYCVTKRKKKGYSGVE